MEARTGKKSGLARVAAQLAVPVTLGLLIGGVLAYQAGSTNNAVQPVPLGAVPTPTPSFGQPPASTATTPAATPTNAATAATVTTARAHASRGIIVPVNPLSAPQFVVLYQLTRE